MTDIVVNMVYGYRFMDTDDVQRTEEMLYLLQQYEQSERVSPDKFIEVIYVDNGAYIGKIMYEQAAPEDCYDFEQLGEDVIEVPAVFYLPYPLATFAEARSPQIYAFWTAPY